MNEGDKVICKKDFITYTNSEFEKGKEYEIIGYTKCYRDILITVCINDCNNFTFYINHRKDFNNDNRTYNYEFRDYFYTIEDIRKMKIKTIL